MQDVCNFQTSSCATAGRAHNQYAVRGVACQVTAGVRTIRTRRVFPSQARSAALWLHRLRHPSCHGLLSNVLTDLCLLRKFSVACAQAQALGPHAVKEALQEHQDGPWDRCPRPCGNLVSGPRAGLGWTRAGCGCLPGRRGLFTTLDGLAERKFDPFPACGTCKDLVAALSCFNLSCSESQT